MKKMKGKVKGTVLFTVLTVMMVMVLFLMSTLILTTSAQRRTYYTYFQKQAQYAAQSALDTVSSLLYSYGEAGTDEGSSSVLPDGKSFYDWMKDIDNNSSEAARTITIQFNGKGNQPIMGMDGTAVSCVFEKLDDKSVFWDDINKEIAAKEGWKVTATATVGTGNNRSDYTICNYIYNNRIDTMGEDAENTAAFRMLGAGNFEHEEKTTGTKKKKDYGTIADPYPFEKHAVYTFSPVAGPAANNMRALGPQSSGLNHFPEGRTKYSAATQTQNDLYSVGSSTFIGSRKANTHDTYVFQNQGEGLVVYGDYENLNELYFISQMNNEATEYTKSGYVYVDGTLTMNKVHVDTVSYTNKQANYITQQLLPIYCGAWNVPKNNFNDMGAIGCTDLYLYDPKLDSNFSGTETSLQQFAYNQMNKANVTKGSVTSGNLVCNNNSITFSGKTTIEGDFIFTNPNGTINGNVTVNGIFVCAGTVNGTVNAKGGTKTVAEYSQGYPEEYAQNAPANYQISAMPFSCRLDEIFEHYVRWDLPRSDANATDWEEDYMIKESEAAGHNWTLEPYITDDGTTWYPTTSPTVKSNAFIPAPQLTTTSTISYPTTESAFRGLYGEFSDKSPIFTQDENGNDQLNPEREVCFISHDASGTEQITKITARVISESCTIDLGKLGGNMQLSDGTWVNVKRRPIFIDASKATGKNPIVINLVGTNGSRADEMNTMDIIVNNTTYYPNSSKGDYVTGISAYGDGEHPTHAGKDEVVIWLEGKDNTQRDISADGIPLQILTTGGYYQMVHSRIDAISNPIYPDAGNATAGDKYKFELVPNIAIYGNASTTYWAGGLVLNADVRMPQSNLEIRANQYQNVIATYRQEQENLTYSDAPSSAVMGFGTLIVKDLLGQNKPMYIYLGDGHRPTTYSEEEDDENKDQTYYYHLGDAVDSSQKLLDPKQGNFGVDHQGAN